MRNQIEQFYGKILEDGRRVVSKMEDGNTIAYRPQDRKAAEKEYRTATAFDSIFEEKPKNKEKNPFDEVFG